MRNLSSQPLQIYRTPAGYAAFGPHSTRYSLRAALRRAADRFFYWLGA